MWKVKSRLAFASKLPNKFFQVVQIPALTYETRDFEILIDFNGPHIILLQTYRSRVYVWNISFFKCDFKCDHFSVCLCVID